jgi:hypothetical protein
LSNVRGRIPTEFGNVLCDRYRFHKLEGCRGEVHIHSGWGAVVSEWQEADMSTMFDVLVVSEPAVTPALRTRA